jgi:hypothetical protein
MMDHADRWCDSILAITVLVVTGCAPDAVSPPPVTDPTKVLWALALNHRGITLSTVAPYDTIQLTATPLTVNGQPLTGLPAPIFTSLDLQHVQVSAKGLVHAIGVTTGAEVIASVSSGNDTQTDTAVINVTDTTTPPVLSVFTIHPASGDSTKVAVDATPTITARAYDSAGDSISGLSVYYATSDSLVAAIGRSSGFFNPYRPGSHVTVYATATAYGITKSDSVRYTIGYPTLLATVITPEKDSTGRAIVVFVPDKFVGGPGAMIEFTNLSAPLTGVTFDNPADADSLTSTNPFYAACGMAPIACGTGNIAPFGPTPSDSSFAAEDRFREFLVPGTYKFHSTIGGATGVLTVVVAQ